MYHKFRIFKALTDYKEVPKYLSPPVTLIIVIMSYTRVMVHPGKFKFFNFYFLTSILNNDIVTYFIMIFMMIKNYF